MRYLVSGSNRETTIRRKIGEVSTRKAEKHGTVLVIHENHRRAKFFDGVLRSGFCVSVVNSSADGLEHLRKNPVDLILCQAHCLNTAPTDLLDALENDFEFLEIPLILLVGDRSSECWELEKPALNAADCISESINPCLLNWKVMKWISLKRELGRLRAGQVRSSGATAKDDDTRHDIAARKYLNSSLGESGKNTHCPNSSATSGLGSLMVS